MLTVQTLVACTSTEEVVAEPAKAEDETSAVQTVEEPTDPTLSNATCAARPRQSGGTCESCCAFLHRDIVPDWDKAREVHEACMCDACAKECANQCNGAVGTATGECVRCLDMKSCNAVFDGACNANCEKVERCRTGCP